VIFEKKVSAPAEFVFS